MACAQLHTSNHKADNNFNSFASRSCSMSVGVSERMLGFWSSENMEFCAIQSHFLAKQHNFTEVENGGDHSHYGTPAAWNPWPAQKSSLKSGVVWRDAKRTHLN
jgi:hypothetical protein